MASVPLLPNVVKPLKDAVCAAKETVGQVVHKVREITVLPSKMRLSYHDFPHF